MRILIACLLLLGWVQSAQADNTVLYTYDGSFEDATFAVEGAIIGKGLVIDYVSHTGEMLARTAADVGSTVEIFKGADIFLFCSAVVSRKVMEADPLNIVHCPYSIFVIEDGNGVRIGHRTYPEGPMKMVQDLLVSIVDDAVSF
jgi:uncharacterized protein (DUF302 family)